MEAEENALAGLLLAPGTKFGLIPIHSHLE